MDIDAVVLKIAQELELEDGLKLLNMAAWSRICVVGRIGMDRRTHKAWLEVAIAEGLLAPRKPTIGTKVSVWEIDREAVNRVINGSLSLPKPPRSPRSEAEGDKDA